MLKLWKVTENEIKVKNENSHFLNEIKIISKVKIRKITLEMKKKNQWKSMEINEN